MSDTKSSITVLSEFDKMTIKYLFMVEGKNMKQIAAHLDKNYDTVRKYIHSNNIIQERQQYIDKFERRLLQGCFDDLLMSFSKTTRFYLRIADYFESEMSKCENLEQVGKFLESLSNKDRADMKMAHDVTRQNITVLKELKETEIKAKQSNVPIKITWKDDYIPPLLEEDEDEQ